MCPKLIMYTYVHTFTYSNGVSVYETASIYIHTYIHTIYCLLSKFDVLNISVNLDGGGGSGYVDFYVVGTLEVLG